MPLRSVARRYSERSSSAGSAAARAASCSAGRQAAHSEMTSVRCAEMRCQVSSPSGVNLDQGGPVIVRIAPPPDQAGGIEPADYPGQHGPVEALDLAQLGETERAPADDDGEHRRLGRGQPLPNGGGIQPPREPEQDAPQADHAIGVPTRPAPPASRLRRFPVDHPSLPSRRDECRYRAYICNGRSGSWFNRARPARPVVWTTVLPAYCPYGQRSTLSFRAPYVH